MTRWQIVLATKLTLLALPCVIAGAQETESEAGAKGAVRGSLVEDRAARKLLEAGDARLDANEATKAVEVWKSVIERYPRGRARFDAHLRLGKYFLEREKAYDRARVHYEAASSPDNPDDQQRAEATLKLGVCFHHARNYGKAFQVLRDVIEKFPVSPQVNDAYYHIGLGHFQLGHYSRAIQALEKVGATVSEESAGGEKLEAGKRLFVRIDDADLAVLDADQSVPTICRTRSGDEEKVECFPVGRNVRLVFGSVPTKLGKPTPNNGVLEVRGGDAVEILYVDGHTADKKVDARVQRQIMVVGTAMASLTDGAFAETVQGVVLGKAVNARVIDADFDTTDGADRLIAKVEVWRLKTDSELETETIARANATPATPVGDAPVDDPSDAPEIDKWKLIDTVETPLVESRPTQVATDRTRVGEAEEPSGDNPKSDPTGVDDGAMRTGVFQVSVSLVKSDVVVAGDDKLQALPSDEVRLVYVDERHVRDGARPVRATARVLEGAIGGVRVTKAEISDQELKIQTQLKTADALTQIGSRYKEFGLQLKANEKFEQAISVCEDAAPEAQRLRGPLLEQLYVQLWTVYFAMDRLEMAAAMCERLQSEFPDSGFVDDALLQLGEVARKQGALERAIGIYTRLAQMEKSALRGEAQFGVAECYEAMAAKATAGNMADSAAQLRDRAFQEYKRVYDQFPDSGRVGEAVAKMANYYYIQKDYARAVDVFETVLNNHPDAKFLDVILFNYGRCLYRMDRKAEAQRRFEQLLAEFPESALAADAKKISEALAKAP